MGRRRKGSQARAQGRVRGRVRERVRGRGEQGGTGRRRGPAFDMGAIEGYANRLADRAGGASGLAGAASGLAGGGLAHRLMGSNAESSDEDFRAQVNERLDLLDERLLRLEEQMRTLLEGGDLQESGEDPHSNQ